MRATRNQSRKWRVYALSGVHAHDCTRIVFKIPKPLVPPLVTRSPRLIAKAPGRARRAGFERRFARLTVNNKVD